MGEGGDAEIEVHGDENFDHAEHVFNCSEA
jgi:hypothetical protein